MPTPDYTRGWSAALVAVEREVAAHGFYTAAAVVRGMLAGVPAAEPAPSCLVGGDPPVPGVGWGIQDAENPWVHPVRSVQLCEEGWVVVYLTGGGDEIADHLSCVALYRPGDPADQPYWRRE